MWKEIRASFFTIVFIFLGIALYTKLFGPLPLSVNSISTTKTDLFTVDGTGEVTAIPDTALISFGVTKTASTVEDAKNQVNGIINKITADIKQLGVDVKNIQTTDYSVNPQYTYYGDQQNVVGYTVSAQVEAKLSPIDKANNAIDAATKDGANQVGDVQFILDDQEQKSLENQARKLAIADAKEKAASISRAADIQLGRIINVQENTEAPRPLPMMAGALKADNAQSIPTQLSPGQNKISITVTLSYETY